jgi:lipopolysaccharide transport system ATP-binding protein
VPQPVVVFDNVSKKFARGERHDSLRDLIPSVARRLLRPRADDALGEKEFWALRDVTFAVGPGEALGIIGPNGAGKSTTLKLLTRILKPTSGFCVTRGRTGALIEVAAGFHPDLTGRENIFLQGAIMGMKRAEISRKLEPIVEFAGIADFIETPVKRYSSGMQARLGFSIAAHLDPNVMLVDEVLSVGDMAFQEKCFARMLEFKRQGVAIVLVSHNLQAVATLCDNAVYLSGNVRAAGPATDVVEAYVRSTQKAANSHTTDTPAVESAAFMTSNGMRVGTHRDVPPGEALTLRAILTNRDALDDVTFGFIIHRSTDQLVVYDRHIRRSELGGAPLEPGHFSLDLQFKAHLVRGHYYISVHVLDNPTQEFLLPPTQLATLGVTEHQSRSGVADVEFSATLSADHRSLNDCVVSLAQ